MLDRLSKLEENINRLMREKKQKEQKRGYVGTPLASPHAQHSPYLNFDSSQDLHPQHPDRPKNTFASILERKQKFFESLQNNQEDSRNIVYNLKYIPVEREQPHANIQKIRHIFQNNEEDNFMDNLDYFLTANPRRNQDALPYPATLRPSRDDFQEEEKKAESRGRNSSSLYMHRYANKLERDPRVHYMPSHLEQQTVIEPPRRRYFHRDSLHSNRTGNEHPRPNETLKNSQVSRHS